MSSYRNDNWNRRFLWGAVSVGAGLIIGYALNLDQRNAAYLAVTILIFYIFFACWGVAQERSMRSREERGRASGGKEFADGLDLALPHNFESDEQRRDWLDGFLVRQQDL